MKKLDLDKSFELEFDNQCLTCRTQMAKGTTKKVTYQQLLETALNSQPQGGFDVAEMSIRLKIMEKIKKGGAVDDSEMAKLYELANGLRFAMMNQGYVEFFEHLEEVHKSKGE